jgi:RHS repeat-associated protein
LAWSSCPVTRVSRWILSNGISINTYAQYDVAGNGVKGIDGRGLVSIIDYIDSFSDGTNRNTYAYPTHTISPIPDIGNNFCSTIPLETTTAYDFSTGLVTSSTDANGQTTAVEYNDALDRPTRVVRPAGGGWTSLEYNWNQYGDYVHTQVLQNTSGTTTHSYQFFDGLGRSYRSFQYVNSDPNNPYLTADTQYDSLGRVWRVSNPYLSAGSASAINPSGNWTTTIYDALGRVKTVTTPDGAQVVTTYSGNQVTVQDQKSKARSSVTDALGRLRSVVEDPNGLAYQTSYDYDALGNLSIVTQGAQHRYFMYDSLSRLIRAKNPEQDANAGLILTDPISGNSQWSIGYSYDAKGNLSTRTDARGITATYIYDNLNRNITVNYSDGSHIDRIYDSATNGRGRLRGSYQYPATGAYSHTAIDTYDAMGRPTYQRQHFYANGGWGTAYVTQRSYDLAGHVLSQTYPSGRTVSYTYDQAGRTNTFTGNLGDGVTRTYAASISYDEWNGLAREQFGTDTPLYHKEHRNVRGQLYDMRLSTINDDGNWNRGAIVNYYSFQPYGFGTSGPDNNGNLLVQQHWVPGDDSISTYSLMQQNYDYDALNRLKWVGEYQNAATNTGAQDYSYDRYGNRTMSGWGTGINNQQFAVDKNTNRIGVPSGMSGVMQYDQNGNLYNDTYSGMGSRTYDAENRMVSASNNASQQSSYTYDAEGHRVRRNSYNQETWQAYGMDGELLAEYTANIASSSPQKEYGYRNGELLIVATSSSGLAAITPPTPEASAITASADLKVNPSTNLLAMNNSFVISEWRRKKEQGLISDTSLPLFLPSLMDASPTLLLSQSSSQIVFASNRDGNAQLYLMNSDGSSQTRLTNNLANDESPKWSPDNSCILFQSDRDNPYSCLSEVYLMSADGSSQMRLSNNTEDDSYAVWSPDGSRIAFQSARNDLSYQVYMMNSDGSNQVNISNSNSNDGQPSWSPDGTRIAFTSDRDHPGTPSIYVMNSNGSSQTRLTFSAATIRDEQPAWSPDGVKLAFTSTRDSVVESWQETDDEGGVINRTLVRTNKEVYLMNADGSNQVRLTNSLGNDDSPQWSNDGTKIVFRSERERDCYDPIEQVWVMNIDGSNQVDLSNNGYGDYSPNWQRITSNLPPTASITSPANGATFTAPTNITITANAADGDGTISKVEFYQGTTLIGTDTTAPYTVSWNNVSSGNYQLTAKAMDNVGASSTSSVVNITVSAPPATAQISWIVADQLGTPRMIVDQTGSLVGIKRHDYLPFGEEIGAGTGGRMTQQGYVGDNIRQKFTGTYERDVETGLDYAKARYYSSTMGRYTSVDPIVMTPERFFDPQQFNLYSYTRNNPLRFIDPTVLNEMKCQ